MRPLLTSELQDSLLAALRGGQGAVEASLDLGRTRVTVRPTAAGWSHQDAIFPWFDACKDRTIYQWNGTEFEAIARFSGSLIKLVPTEWGPPTFEIDGIKMLPTAKLSPYVDAQRKVQLIEPRGKRILDTCGGLGYFAAWCLQGQASDIVSFEKNPDVLWLRETNPWSPRPAPPLNLQLGDVAEKIHELPDASFDAILHDPPRFGIAGELYSQSFYEQLARVLKRRGRLFHYTGTPNKLSSGRDLPAEVSKRLRNVGFEPRNEGDGVLAVRR